VYYQLTSLKVIGSVGEPSMGSLALVQQPRRRQEMSCRGYVVANGNRRNYDFANCVCNAYKTYICFFTITGIQPVLMDENATKLKEIRLPEVYVLNFLGPELPEPFGAITKYKDTYFSTFQVNISLETALCVTKLELRVA
jgi:hypothetical protein